MSSLSREKLEDALLGPGWTPERFREKNTAITAADLIERRTATLTDAALFADVPKAWVLEIAARGEGTEPLSTEDMGKDAERYISINPRVLSGTPCVRGTRVPAHYIADMKKNGDTVDDILSAYPSITEGQVHAAVAYTRAFPRLARPGIEPPWRQQQPIMSSETPLNDLPR